MRQSLARAGALEEVVRPVVAALHPLTAHTFSHDGATYQAAALPGAQTLALAPARLQEVDLVAPVAGHEPIRLVRSYNSFFDPRGPWGRGWALDLPQLEPCRVPVRRGDKGVEFRVAYDLFTPLNSMQARFSRVEAVPTLNGSQLLVPEQPGEFLGLADAKPDFLTGPTLVLLRKDGGRWHFGKNGELVATEAGGARTVYERDGEGRLTRIVGLLGKRAVSTIELLFGANGRLESAKSKAGRRETVVRYEYNSVGRLNGIVAQDGRQGYSYEGSLLNEVTAQGTGGGTNKTPEVTFRRFKYGPGGRLLAETGADGTKTEYRAAADGSGSAVTALRSGKPQAADYVRYDLAMRPIEASAADGTRASWTYPQGGGTVMELAPPDGRKLQLTVAADARSRTVQLGDGRKFVSRFDAMGRLTSLTDNGQPVLDQAWSPDSRLLVAGDGATAVHYEYDPDGLLSQVVLAPPGESGTFKNWQATRLDPAGRPLEVRDSRGLQASLQYDADGQLRAAAIKRDGKSYGFQIERDAAGRVSEVKSSWGASRYAYDPAGLMDRLEVESAGRKSLAVWKDGRLQKVRQFDGGEVSFSYYKDGKRAGLPKEIVAPNQLVLGYEYDASNRLSKVEVGSAYRLMLEYGAKGRLKRWTYAERKP